jgi:hypothetical protein
MGGQKMQKEYRISYGAPIPSRMLPGGEKEGQEWLYPFSIVEKQFIDKPEEDGKTITSELKVFFWRRALRRIRCWQYDNKRHIEYIDNPDCLRKIFEIVRRMNKRQMEEDFKPADPKPVEMDFENIEEWVELKLDPSRIQDPAGAEDLIVIPQKIGF